jgi:hypothetical protein
MKKLLRVLSDHKYPVVSVSINQMNGSIATLTNFQFRLYTINGCLLCFENIFNPSRGILLNTPTVIKAIPSNDWQQDNSVVITGHKGGGVNLWKMRKIKNSKKKLLWESDSSDSNKNENFLENVEKNSKNEFHLQTSSLQISVNKSFSDLNSMGSNSSKNNNNNNNNSVFSSIFNVASDFCFQFYPISHAMQHTHVNDITCIQLCSSLSSSRSSNRDVVNKTLEDVRSMDLMIGDAKGFVSRWTPFKTDLLPTHFDLNSVINEK